MLLADVMVHTVNTPLEGWRSTLNRVGRDADAVLVTNVFFDAVIHPVVLVARWSLFRAHALPVIM